MIRNTIQRVMTSVVLNKTDTHIINNYGFDDLPLDSVKEIFKDGRIFSHFIENWIQNKYPLLHVPGCKGHDFTDANNADIIYDEKTFTKGGCRFMPSSMIGTGRTFNQIEFNEKAANMVYCIVSNINFPEIKIIFIDGPELIKKYPKGTIPFKDHDHLFKQVMD